MIIGHKLELLLPNNMQRSISIAKYYHSQKQQHDKNHQPPNNHGGLNTNSVGDWRHLRMYELMTPILKSAKGKKWLTIGDGRYGHEAHFIEKQGGIALATDLSTTRLSYAKKIGHIKAYKRENAEHLSFKDDTYDYVLCKESYHHFPLYEMIRVAKKSVVLIEPNDVYRRGLSWKRLLSIEDPSAQVNRFEISGNYVYTISRRELIKIALGIGLPTIAFSGIDDHYIKGVEKELLDSHGQLKKKINFVLKVLDIAHHLGIRDRSLLAAIIFKRKPSKTVRQNLSLAGYNIIDLPKNPYVK